MKNRQYLLVLLLLPFTYISCKKEDNVQPVISLVGSPEVVLPLNGTYAEMGATAKDNEDGDISEFIEISGSVDANKVGEYRIFYDVEDDNGNKAATAKRYVNVVNEADFMVGTYLAEPSCLGTSTTSSYNTSVSVSQDVNNQIYIRTVLWTVEDDPIACTVSGSDITIPLQSVGENTVEGSGSISGSTFILSVVVDGESTYNCTIDHTKI